MDNERNDGFGDDGFEQPAQVDTKRETDRKCPQCAGTMDYDPATGGLKCPYCGHAEAIVNSDNPEESAEERSFYDAEKTGNCDWGAEKKTVICKSCGAESVYDALVVSDVCPYCGSNQVMEAYDVKTLAPNGVCGFKITLKQAADNFKRWIKRKWFCPKAAKEFARPEQFKGVYLPYWTFDAQTDSKYTASYGKDHTHRDSKGNTYTTTTWYNTSGTYSAFIDDQLVSGTTRYNASELKAIEPFDTKDNRVYRPEYVSGFISERYSIGLSQAWDTGKKYINDRLASAVSSKVKSEHNADHVRDVRLSTLYTAITYKYLMLPVWLSSFAYKGKTYRFMVNGQTGKVGGKTPISGWKVALTVLIVLAILALFAYIYNNS